MEKILESLIKLQNSSLNNSSKPAKKVVKLSESQKALKEELLRKTNQVGPQKSNYDLTNAYERALREGIENLYPDNSWTQITKCDIRTTLLENCNNVNATIDKILIESVLNEGIFDLGKWHVKVNGRTIFEGSKKECEEQKRKLMQAKNEHKDWGWGLQNISIEKGKSKTGIWDGSAEKYLQNIENTSDKSREEREKQEWEAGRAERERKSREFDKWMDSVKKRREEEHDRQVAKEKEAKWDSWYSPVRDDHYLRASLNTHNGKPSLMEAEDDEAENKTKKNQENEFEQENGFEQEKTSSTNNSSKFPYVVYYQLKNEEPKTSPELSSENQINNFNAKIKIKEAFRAGQVLQYIVLNRRQLIRLKEVPETEKDTYYLCYQTEGAPLKISKQYTTKEQLLRDSLYKELIIAERSDKVKQLAIFTQKQLKRLNMLQESLTESVQVGDRIRIIDMIGEPDYFGKEGVVKFIDDLGQIHGTWGGCALIPEQDEFEIIDELDTYNESLSESLTDAQIEKMLDLGYTVGEIAERAGVEL